MTKATGNSMGVPGSKKNGRVWGALLASVALCAMAFAAKEYVAPKAFDAKTYPARDAHDNEKVTIAADPYDLPDKAGTVFNLDYRDKGLLPVYLIITNNGDEPVAVTAMRVQLVTADRSKIYSAEMDDLYRRFSRVKRRGDEPSRNPLPIPLPRKGADAGVPKEGLSELQHAPFMAKAVEPHSTAAGFVFFDVAGISQPLAGAHLYVMNVRDANGHDLMFFDIAMEKYLSYRP
jgi:hypothetical protein